ncbi:amino acid adenylation domain-containing protein [Streptosporangium carneum]|uniref:Amino acid adenylation domain-containing protein n=1 Tax=Streptosporangium carneum TaxID=47481 RepID=A0A9W6MGI7_9ACTN|nr:amino acid adenylation domain-containing protein [Streptosporangium carneum]GLK13195.1 hypothetical protein GCM10017600_66060 [Streptosporangium carneum]
MTSSSRGGTLWEPALGDLVLESGAAGRAVELALRNPVQVVVDQGVLRHVARHAAEAPDRPAVIDGERVLSYARLLHRVAEIRRILTGHGLGPGDVVAAAGERCADTPAVFLAIESIGAVYLPIELSWPVGRISEVLRRGSAACLLDYAPAGGHAAAEAAAERGLKTLRVEDESPSDAYDLSGGPLPDLDTPRSQATEVRYIIFTSGTTGVPKGATVEHRGMLNHLWAKIGDLSLGRDDVLAFTAPLVFDISIWQMLAPLLVGGKVAVVRDADLAYPRRLAGSLRRTGSTVVELVPTMVGWLAAEAARTGRDASAFRWLISTGEELRPSLAGQVVDALPGTGLLNAYGPTECSDDVTHHVVTRADLARRRLPVGRAIGNAVLYVLVADQRSGTWRAAEPGEAGDLFVGGLPVGLGYVNDARATAQAFFTDTLDPASPTGRLYRTGDLARVEDGVVHYLGRRDRQVKVAGVRLELDEIEAVLGRHPAVEHCAVTVSETSGASELTAHYVPRRSVSTEELKEFLALSLPAQLIPRRWSQLTVIPLTPNGKIDHRSLRETTSQETEQ